MQRAHPDDCDTPGAWPVMPMRAFLQVMCARLQPYDPAFTFMDYKQIGRRCDS